jgi:hypothetical protein
MDSPESTTTQAASQEAQKHTDSMVTVPLSDVLSNSEHTQPDWKSIEIPETPVESDIIPETPADADEGTETTPKSNRVNSETEQSPTSEGGASIRSRSSGGSVRSADAVEGETDWAALELTEEQESREEGSDEVRWIDALGNYG